VSSLFDAMNAAFDAMFGEMASPRCSECDEPCRVERRRMGAAGMIGANKNLDICIVSSCCGADVYRTDGRAPGWYCPCCGEPWPKTKWLRPGMMGGDATRVTVCCEVEPEEQI
jgi:hypothetical protein